MTNKEFLGFVAILFVELRKMGGEKSEILTGFFRNPKVRSVFRI